MKYQESKKITALGVVIFSFVALLICFAIVLLVDMIFALIVLKTAIPEGFLKVGNVIGSGLGIIASTAMLTAKSGIKGIWASAIMALCIAAIKVLGNLTLALGGYLNVNGLIGMIFVCVFALIGGVLGSALKGR
ncbi:MAG: hypothetical protein IJ043_07115 [Clostridia bacterium]|nr:hypothetical protein [Clostridia bacterium]